MAEQRARTRVDTAFAGALRAEGQATAVELRNVSLQGALCRTERRLPPATPAELSIYLDQGPTIQLEVTVVRATHEGLALRITSMAPEDFAHLRQLVRLHAPDADHIDQELGAV